MSQRYRFRCEYLGSAFHGWQIQNGPEGMYTVQAELERAFCTALRAPVRLIGSGRTDTGVHARGQAVHFEWSGEALNCFRLENAVNGIAASTVRIRHLAQAPQNFHARFSARERYYQFVMFRRPVALGRELGWDISRMQLDLEAMSHEAASFLGTHDFNAFSIPRHDGKSTECTLREFRVEILEDRWIWHIRGNRFLHRQVRAMIGMLRDIGRHRYPLGSVSRVLNGENIGERTWAPPQGLVLQDVVYAEPW